ncbi:MAG: universal stress protein [Candidatus Bathyarchaeota archaeon]|nr:universal stress protein [Candidatus Bathyarchaeota archaeon]
MFAKILVPLDGSEHSLKGLDYAITLAKKFSSVVHIVHIVHIVQAVSAATYDTAFMMRGLYTRASDMAGPSFMIDLKNHLEENGRRILATTEAKTREAGIKAVTTLLYGSPAEEIINFAEKEEMDLIVIGDRGLGSVTRFFLGSVSNKVSRHAPCPVLIVKT